MTEHKIVITLIGTHAIPIPTKTIVHIGDTLRYDTDPPNLQFRVKLVPSPFSADEPLVIKDRDPHPLVTEGRFFWQCFLTPPGGNEVGWFSGEDPESGGDVDVRP